jgi:FAD:protein FMN transferase
VEAWGFGPHGATRTPPGDDELQALRARVGYRLLALDAARSTVAKARPDVACDVSAIGDGWAADRIARAIVALGHRDVLVDVGGEVAARGRRADGGRWRVAVEWPDGARRRTPVLELADAGVATSGDYRKVWTDAQGHRRSHILDPRTGRPVTHDLASVTVVDADGAWAARSRRASAWPPASWCASRTGSSPSGRRRRSTRSSPLPARPSRPAARSFSVC